MVVDGVDQVVRVAVVGVDQEVGVAVVAVVGIEYSTHLTAVSTSDKFRL